MRFDEKTKELKFPIDEILFIDTENKSLPFPHAAECKVRTVLNWTDFERVMSDGFGITDLSDKPNRFKYYNPIKAVVIDSFTRITYLLSEYLKDSGVKGRDFWRDFGDILEKSLMTWRAKSRFVIYTAIDDVIQDADSVDRRQVKVSGRMSGAIESFFTVTLFTHFNAMKPHPEGYQFMTNTDGKNSAKTPVDMFSEKYISNNMAAVLGRIYEYYDMANHPEFMPSPILVVGKSGTGKSTSMKYLFDIAEEVKK